MHDYIFNGRVPIEIIFLGNFSPIEKICADRYIDDVKERRPSMIHRLGMYYLAQQLQASQDAKAALQNGRRSADDDVDSDPEELGMLARTGAVIVADMGAVGLILWITD